MSGACCRHCRLERDIIDADGMGNSKEDDHSKRQLLKRSTDMCLCGVMGSFAFDGDDEAALHKNTEILPFEMLN